MRSLMIATCVACILSGTVAVSAVDAAADDDEYEEVVVRRKKKKKKPAEQVAEAAEAAAVPVAVAPATVIVPATVVVPVVTPTKPAAPVLEPEPKAEEPPPEPSAADAAEPRRLVRYFCKAWKDKDYKRLWWAMSPEYRKKVSLKKFSKLFKSDAEMNGGLLDENILETAKTRDGNEGVKLELIFKFPRAQHRFVMAVAERQPGGAFRIVDSPFIPQDLDDL